MLGGSLGLLGVPGAPRVVGPWGLLDPGGCWKMLWAVGVAIDTEGCRRTLGVGG